MVKKPCDNERQWGCRFKQGELQQSIQAIFFFLWDLLSQSVSIWLFQFSGPPGPPWHTRAHAHTHTFMNPSHPVIKSKPVKKGNEESAVFLFEQCPEPELHEPLHSRASHSQTCYPLIPSPSPLWRIWQISSELSGEPPNDLPSFLSNCLPSYRFSGLPSFLST